MSPGLQATTRTVAGNSQGRWLTEGQYIAMESPGIKDKSKCIQTQTVQFTSCAALIKSVNLSEPQVTHLHNGMQA